MYVELRESCRIIYTCCKMGIFEQLNVINASSNSECAVISIITRSITP